jgi:hypothetical protein
MQGFHFDPSAIDGVDLGLDCDVVVADFEVDVNGTNQKRMTKRNHLGGSLRRLNASHAGNRENVTFLYFAVGNGGSGFWLHENFATRNSTTMGRLFWRYINHAGST